MTVVICRSSAQLSATWYSTVRHNGQNRNLCGFVVHFIAHVASKLTKAMMRHIMAKHHLAFILKGQRLLLLPRGSSAVRMCTC